VKICEKSLSLAINLNVITYENTTSVFGLVELIIQPVLKNKDKIKECRTVLTGFKIEW
jgi:hypothetical protein